jgi:hypothetical protein
MSRMFTLAEATRLLPEAEKLLRSAIDFKSEYQEAEQRIQAFKQHVMLMGGVASDRDRALEDRRRYDLVVEQLKNTLEALNGLGCIVKDLDTGLLDFPTNYRGREVYLCWKLGEAEIAFWHGVEEGFAGRKAIDRDFQQNHRGGE